MPFPEKNELPVIYCSVIIEEKERKDTSCQMCQKAEEIQSRGKCSKDSAKIGEEGNEENGSFVCAAETSEELGRIAQASTEKLQLDEPAKCKRVSSSPLREQLPSSTEPPLHKENRIEPSVQITKL